MTDKETRLQEAAKQVEIVREGFEDEANGATNGDDADEWTYLMEQAEIVQATVGDLLDMLQEKQNGSDYEAEDEGDA